MKKYIFTEEQMKKIVDQVINESKSKKKEIKKEPCKTCKKK
jgi:hypothetical protein